MNEKIKEELRSLLEEFHMLSLDNESNVHTFKDKETGEERQIQVYVEEIPQAEIALRKKVRRQLHKLTGKLREQPNNFINKLLSQLPEEKQADFLYLPASYIASFIQDAEKPVGTHFNITDADVDLLKPNSTGSNAHVRISDKQHKYLTSTFRRVGGLIAFAENNNYDALLVTGKRKQQTVPTGEAKVIEELDNLKRDLLPGLRALESWLFAALQVSRSQAQKDSRLRPQHEKGQIESIPAARLAYALGRHFKWFGLPITKGPDSNSRKMLEFWFKVAALFLPAKDFNGNWFNGPDTGFKIPDTGNQIKKVHASLNPEQQKS